jgi:hypothetical protein
MIVKARVVADMAVAVIVAVCPSPGLAELVQIPAGYDPGFVGAELVALMSDTRVAF